MLNDVSRFNWIPARTAAKMCGVSRQRIYQLINEGKLAAVTMDGTYFVSRATVEARIISQSQGKIKSKSSYQIWEENLEQ